MPREKIKRQAGRKYHSYSEEEKKIFVELRLEAIQVLKLLKNAKITSFVHGSIARGDVNRTSDIDIYIPVQIPSYQLEIINDINVTDRRVIMGTPNSTIRGVLNLSENISISFLLSPPREREVEFYKFSGLLYLSDLLNNKRIAGVSKQLLLIEPEGDGYWISSVFTNKKKTIHALSISQRIIDERIRVLTRRDKVGRTGLFLEYTLTPHENFEQALKQIADKNVIVRRKIRR